ncbi:exosortase family protein XrtF [uncultured Algibacter sp.]|uniref:exosortase family protein XrtF n=1 Tax=uncultured Algibacter sp. TaxID=298659 RepID=UPI00262536B8|nr:exosortase family protein XrtF [uncultured Algibacter sp.]
MKELFVKYKAVIRFISVFLLVYAILSVGYKFYLQYSNGSKFYPDYFTNLVAVQTQNVLTTFGYTAEVLAHKAEPSMKVIMNEKYIARIVEGCNGLSVIILFVSFIVAFSGKLKTTFFYVISGSVLIYSVNLLRMVLLSMGLYHYPEYENILHTVIFPAIIYGLVFLLWIFWVNRFSKLKSENV